MTNNNMTNEDLREILTENRRSIIDELCVQYLDAKPLISAVIESLYTSTYNPRQSNIIAYGKGGYGKSEIVRKVLEVLDLRYIVIDFDKSMTEERMKGGVNLKTWHQDGELIHNLQSSMFAHEYVIIEEGLSAPADVLSSLRNALSSGKIFDGGKSMDVATKFIAICTNEPPTGFLSDVNMEALLQRFPYSISVDWNHIDDSKKMDNFIALVGRNFDVKLLSNSATSSLKYTLLAAEASPRQCLQIGLMLSTSYKLSGTVDVAKVLTFLNISGDEIESLKREVVSSKISKIISDIDVPIRDAMSKIVSATKPDIHLLGPATLMINSTLNRLRNELDAAEKDCPGITEMNSATINRLMKTKSDLLALAGQAALESYLK